MLTDTLCHMSTIIRVVNERDYCLICGRSTFSILHVTRTLLPNGEQPIRDVSNKNLNFACLLSIVGAQYVQ